MSCSETISTVWSKRRGCSSRGLRMVKMVHCLYDTQEIFRQPLSPWNLCLLSTLNHNSNNLIAFRKYSQRLTFDVWKITSLSVTGSDNPQLRSTRSAVQHPPSLSRLVFPRRKTQQPHCLPITRTKIRVWCSRLVLFLKNTQTITPNS